MKQQLRFEFTRAWHAKKTQWLAVLLILLPLAFFIWGRYQAVDNVEDQALRVRVSIRSNMGRYNALTKKKPANKAMWGNLVSQLSAAVGIPAGLTLNDEDMLTDSVLTLAQLQQDARKLHFAGTASLMVPPESTVAETIVVTKAVIKNKIPLQTQIQDAASLVNSFFKHIGPWFYFIILAFVADLGMDRWLHPSLIRNLPVPKGQRDFSKIICAMASFLVPLFLGLVLGCLYAGLRYGFGSWRYPVAMAKAQLTAVPLWQAASAYAAALVVLTLFAAVAALWLNAWLKNIYLTLFAGALLGGLGALLPVTKLGAFFPLQFLNVTRWLTDPAANLNLGFGWGFLVMLVWSLVLLALLMKKEGAQQ